MNASAAILYDDFFQRINKDKASELNIWIGDEHGTPNGSMLLIDLAKNIDPNHIGNLVIENTLQVDPDFSPDLKWVVYSLKLEHMYFQSPNFQYDLGQYF
jgi:hypothetical protein